MLSLHLIICLFVYAALAIWPIPTHYASGTEVLWIAQDVRIVYEGANQVQPNLVQQSRLMQWLKGSNKQTASYGYGTRSNYSSAGSNIISTAISSTRDTLFHKNFVPWKFHPRNSRYEPASNSSRTYIETIVLLQNGTDPKDVYKPLAGDVDESYSLSLTADGKATITASTSVGLAYGLTSFTQLFYKHTCGEIYTPLAPVQIFDRPKFQHRGLNMDVSRSWYAPGDILRMIDALSYNKMNRLHIHATDAQSWPLEIPALPLLAAKGAYGQGMSYSPAVIQSIQQYGAVRGVEVYLEIDMPGHTSSIAYSYPDLNAAFNMQPDWSSYAAEPPSGTLKLNSSAVSNFLNTLLGDLLPRVYPYSSYFHTGGDEVNPNAYMLDDTVQSNDTAVIQPLMQKFVDRNHEQVRAAGMTPIVWEEMLLQWNISLGSDVVVQTWQSDDAVLQTVQQGHKALVGNYQYWYLDCGQGQWLDFYPGVSSKTYYPYADYCSPRKNWRLMYAYDPLSNIPTNLSHLVLGGEAHIWSEQTDPVNLDRQVWPRTCAAAEVLWSGAKDEQGRNRSQITASPRLAEMRERLVARGVLAEPVQMPFCTMNGTQCAL